MAENIFIIFTKIVFFLQTQRTQRLLVSDYFKIDQIILYHKVGFKSYKNKINRISMTLTKKEKDDLTAGGSHSCGWQRVTEDIHCRESGR